MSTISYTRAENAIATIRFNRDEKRNAVGTEMATGILRGLDRAVQEDARVIVLRARIQV